METVETGQLQVGDQLPLPARLPTPASPLRRMDTAEQMGGYAAYVQGPGVFDRAVPSVARWALQVGARAPLSDIGSRGVAVLERFGPTKVTAPRATESLPASVNLDRDWLRFLGLFVAEGHIAHSYASITPGPELLELTEELLGSCGIRFFPRGEGELGIGSRVVTAALLTLCGSPAADKHLPAFWPQLDDRALGDLLAGYFEGDGWVEPRGAAVCAVTKSWRLANELAYALLRFGY